MIRNHEGQKQIEKAISFLVESIIESGRNPKAVILHSLRTAFYLDKLGYGVHIVIAAVLHDILEDSDVTSKELKEKFGEKIAKLVEANSFKESIEDETERYKELFQRCVESGRGALIVKAADILENSNYYDNNKKILEKWKYFIDVSELHIKEEKVWQNLTSRYNELSNTP